MAEKVKLILEAEGKNIKALDSASQKLKKLDNKTQQVSKDFKLFELAAVAAIGAAGLAVKKMVSDSLQAYANLEKGLANVYTLLDENTFEKHGKEIETGALEILGKYSFALEDINKALFDSVSAGVEAKDSINFLESAARLAQGGVTGLGVAVDGMTSIINAYHLEQSKANRVADAFFTAQKFGKTTVEELANNIGKVAPIASAAGISFEELLAATSQLTLSGMSTDEAVTSLKGTITALINPTEEVQKKLTALGIPFGNAAFEGGRFGETMALIKEKTEGNIDVIAELLPNVRALLSTTAMATDEGLKKYDEILNEVKTDTESLDEAFKKQEETVSNLIATYKNKFIVQQIKVGEKIATTVRWLIKYNEKMKEIRTNILLTATEASNKILNFLGISTDRWTKEQQRAKESVDAFLQNTTTRIELAEKEEIVLTETSNAIAAIVAENEAKKAAASKATVETMIQDDKRRTAAANAENKKRTKAEIEAMKKEEKLMKNHWAYVLTGTKLNAEQRIAADQAIGDAFSNLTSLMQSKNREAFEVGKAAAIASTTIKTWEAAQAAFTSLAGIPIVGPVLASAAAAAAVAAGLFRVRQIAAQQLPAAEFGGVIPGSPQGTTLIAGEKNKSEAIIPLENTDVMEKLSGQTIINVNVENLIAEETVPRKIAEQIDEALEDLRRTQSSSFAVGLETQMAVT